jgi:hypothetical protein
MRLHRKTRQRERVERTRARTSAVFWRRRSPRPSSSSPSPLQTLVRMCDDQTLLENVSIRQEKEAPNNTQIARLAPFSMPRGTADKIACEATVETTTTTDHLKIIPNDEESSLKDIYNIPAATLRLSPWPRKSPRVPPP